MSAIQSVRDGAISVITLNVPEKRNALGDRLLKALLGELDGISRDPSVRCVVLTGAGDVFCAGGDLLEISALSPFEVRNFLRTLLWPVLRSISFLDVPVIVALNGPVAGAGIGLPLMADKVIASDQAKFILAFGQIGAMPDAGIIHALVASLGGVRAKEILYGDGVLAANEAWAYGLYTDVVDSEKLMERAMEEASAMASLPSVAFRFTKHAIREAGNMSLDMFMEYEANSQALLNTSEDFREGLAAFAEKRPPNFRGC